MPPEAGWIAKDGKAMAFAHCADGGNAMPIVDRDDREGDKRSRVLMVRCDSKADFSGQIDALKKASDRFASGAASSQLSAELRAKVIADLDRALADLARTKHPASRRFTMQEHVTRVGAAPGRGRGKKT